MLKFKLSLLEEPIEINLKKGIYNGDGFENEDRY